MVNLVSIERRLRRRYAIQLDLRCMPTGSGETLAGTTCDIGSNEVRRRLERSLDEGEAVQLSSRWPILLEERCPLQLALPGFVTHSHGSETAIAFTRYEFRLLRVAPPCGIMN